MAARPNKKPRFDYRNPSTLAADEDDAPEDLVLEADVIGKGRQTKRGAVNVDAYESDSDNDTFDARAAEREKKKKPEGGHSKDEDDEDMFAEAEAADGDRDEEVSRQGKKKKQVNFLNQEDIEGQVMDSKSGGHVSSELLLGSNRKTEDVESSSESGDDDERDKLDEEMEPELAAEIGAGGKKRHAPKLDAFNLGITSAKPLILRPFTTIGWKG
jgi:CD2 antigen cytoplasmic tail-binding protein 2